MLPVDPWVGRKAPRKLDLLIDGEWVKAQSEQTFQTYNPATGDLLAECAQGDEVDIDIAVRAARRAFESGPWSRLTATERGRLIWKLGDLLFENLEEFAELETLDNGKPISVTRAVDVPLAAELFHYMAGWANKLEGNTIPLSVPYTPGAMYHAYTLREPVGRGRADRAVELPAADGRLEAGPRAGRREHGGVQAGRAHPADRAAPR